MKVFFAGGGGGWSKSILVVRAGESGGHADIQPIGFIFGRSATGKAMVIVRNILNDSEDGHMRVLASSSQGRFLDAPVGQPVRTIVR